MSDAAVGKLLSDCLKKKRYRTRGFAERLAKSCAEKRNADIRVYACAICQGFHLTHKESRRTE